MQIEPENCRQFWSETVTDKMVILVFCGGLGTKVLVVVIVVVVVVDGGGVGDLVVVGAGLINIV